MTFTLSSTPRAEPAVPPIGANASDAPQNEGVQTDTGMEADNDERLLRVMAQRVAQHRIAHAAEVIADQVALSSPQGSQPALAGNATRLSSDFLRSP